MNAAWENLVAAASESNAPAAVPITKQPPPPTPAAVQSIVAPASPAPSSQAPAPAAPQQQQPATSVSFTPEGLPRFGFYLPVWNQIPSVLGVLKATRKFYPESPIYVLQDGGNIDFGPVCAMPKYRCIFQRGKGENSRWNPHSWFHRITQAALILGTEFVIYLEPDVKVARRHLVDPKHDAGGIFDNFNPEVGDETRNYLERLGRDRNPCFKATWHWFGLAGGSYFRTEAIMDAFAPGSQTPRLT
ncbi:unnamed protein product [Polarella glacialis]|uniref:Uncharacterized protein n=1 Tax=Polarella glacialis TaxID=89957 RepID=A0A813IZ70_POLGL|nr:unnamed protein product [Polarella glacialis]